MMTKGIRVLVLGATGMLGNAVLRCFSELSGCVVFGTSRSDRVSSFLDADLRNYIITSIDVSKFDDICRAFDVAKPTVVINCIGLVKQLDASEDVLTAVPLNALLPHQLARLCSMVGARLVHISTDCVFSGAAGSYCETDFPDANDVYGRTKFLGEVDYPNAITLRTSIIGRELSGSRSLLCWFLSQKGRVNGYTEAVFSGLPTDELARVIRDVVLPRADLRGLFHVAAKPIDKYTLLKLVADVFKLSVEIVPNSDVKVDRSLSADKFKAITGYVAPDWSVLIKNMYERQWSGGFHV
ncbi:SDR family oxidoreductase [Zoogloea sp. 1C4]|uniref:dTDP-4-dehydrorhamnose reductase family protein n=1 Tax=Zoogloea sp. 1C4 TaxID=2570190 RepID=UPI001D1749FE|nr:SDR family oxidoreductase [Zoogloea sp. 1C4]